MKIWIDLRFLKNTLYSQYIKFIIDYFIQQRENTSFIVYTNDEKLRFPWKNIEIKVVNIEIGSIQEQTKYLKILKDDNNDLMLFFDQHKPILYKDDYYTIVAGLKDVYYQDFSNYFTKYKFLLLLEKNLKNSKKLICFDENTSDELIERLNILENKIEMIPGAFLENSKQLDPEQLKIDISSKYNLQGNYLVYSGWNGIEKNLDRLLQVFYRLKKENYPLTLILLGDSIAKDLSLRNLIIKYELQDRINFLGSIKNSEKTLLYKNSTGVIFPSLYEPFPFKLSEPVFSNTAIIASKLENIEKIFGNNIHYFSPISANNMVHELKKFIDLKEKTKDYSEIKTQFSVKNSAKELLSIIQ